jgi:hypothetical protein
MGIDVHTLKFLMFAAAKQPLGRVATLGRRRIDVPAYWLRKLTGGDSYGQFCEKLLKQRFGAGP